MKSRNRCAKKGRWLLATGLSRPRRSRSGPGGSGFAKSIEAGARGLTGLEDSTLAPYRTVLQKTKD